MEVLADDEYGYSVKYFDTIIRYDKQHHFLDSFRLTDGFSITSNQLLLNISFNDIKEKMDTLKGFKEFLFLMYNSDPEWFGKEEPFMRSMPSLIDCGIMSSCAAAKAKTCFEQCYQKCDTGYKEDISLEDYKKVINEVKGHVFSCALGGAGNVHDHVNFKEILEYSKQNNVIPNYTTSGYNLTEFHVEITKENTGAVAVSWNRNEYWRDRAIKMFLDAGIKTNIHFVVGKDSIDEAISRVKNDDFPKGIFAVLFLLYKPVGLGKEDNVLSVDNPRLKEFMALADKANTSFKWGFDACTIPALINNTSKIDMNSCIPCDAARMSCYIDAELNMMPCSFDNQDKKFSVNIKDNSVHYGWMNKKFSDYRYAMFYSCPDCKEQSNCFGGCMLCKSITLCNRKERTTNEG